MTARKASASSASPDAGGEPFERVGTRLQNIPVRISYRIIELFSASLYSSPHKALEELVSNSYDAGAGVVDLFLPGNVSSADAVIWVVDDGKSMDLQGLIDLWQIGRSPKEATRDSTPSGQRKPIGKFGIGKLATYVVASKLTYICRRGAKYLAVTMDFNRINKTSETETDVHLAVRSLTKEQAAEALAPLRGFEGGVTLVDKMLGSVMPNWTAAAMSALRPDATGIRRGRLEWILSTALPASPRFKLRINGKAVKPSAENVNLIEAWKIGNNKSVGKVATAVPKGSGAPYVEVDGLGRVSGTVEIFEDLLTKGKAERMGRSNGFFVRVRGRLINLEDPLFGNNALSHAVFNRFRLIVDADGLDRYLTSTRESVQESDAVTSFRSYLRSEFYKAQEIYEKWQNEQQTAARVATRVGATASSLSRQPLVTVVRLLLDGDIDSLLLTKTPDVDADGAVELLEELEESLDAPDDGPIRDVEPEALGADQFIASYDPQLRKVSVNLLHPFVANFIDMTKNSLPFELLAVAEVLTEAYLIEEGVPIDHVERIMRRRDEFLRELVAERRVGPSAIAQNLVDMEEDADGLEAALHECFRSLGYTVTPLGKSGNPDGLASAEMGYDANGVQLDYAFTYDAKSTGKKRVKAKTVGVSTLGRHKKDAATQRAQFSVVVAKDFEGANDRLHALGKECVEEGVTPIKVRDLALLVQTAAARAVGPRRLRDWLDTCRTPKESHDWVLGLASEPEDDLPPLKELLQSIVFWRGEAKDQVELGNIVSVLKTEHSISATKAQVREWVGSLQQLAPGYLTLIGDVIELETSPQRILDALAEQHRDLPAKIRTAYLNQWLN